ncbi:spirocyclase AveC family protein [Streptomyces sp. NBC_01275]|uniref:spirocyclase AveC family protein n=1 Tax=Streptomyces sp. NBC_01275 TaxID=2903807 RepID=UPI00225B89AA|nr:spirocyclase AveC family protein [Streptomyces sp. NBC_01275]MCX4760052.1 spirocyclase AveC family protein [Streptomyces sp. NBC_01275]
MTQELRPTVAAGFSVRTRISPVGVWSGLGVAAVALQAWVLGRWLIFSELRSAPPSGYRISGARMAAAWALQVVVAATVLSIGIVLVRRCLRERTVTFDAALYTGLVLSMWQDPILYWNKLYVVYNQNLPNVETWGPYIPGWHGPDTAGQPIYESVAGGSGLAYPIVMVWFWLQYKVYRQIARRRPHWSSWRLFLTAAGIGALIDLPLEPLFLFTGVFAYPVGYPPLTLFTGHWYQLPLLEVLSASLVLVTPVLVLRRIDQSRPVPWLFSTSSRTTTPARPLIRLLAGVGLANVVILAYLLSNVAIAELGGPFPRDMPSWLW